MAAEAQEWMLSLLFVALGLALGRLLSAGYAAINALSTASWPFSSPKDVSGDCRKATSGFCQSKTRGACSRREDQRKTLPGSRGSQLDAFQHPCGDVTELDQRENAVGSCERQLDVLKHPCASIPKPENHGGNDVHGSELDIQASNSSEELATANGNLKPDPYNPSKRQGYLSWDDYFMAIAFLSAHRSKDPNRQVGACLVSQDRVILGIGYNGFPRGCSDDELPWAKMSANGDPLQTKYPYVCHAEVNAILNKNHASACGQSLYVTMFPCNECAKIIIQAGVAEVIYFVGKNSSGDFSYNASRKLLAMAGIKVWQHKPTQQTVILDFK
eukprot:c2464_g1_i1 orf=104-1090(+)